MMELCYTEAGNLMQMWRKRGQPKDELAKREDSSTTSGFVATR